MLLWKVCARRALEQYFWRLALRVIIKLNIPGENLKGVVDCISWLRDFNLNQDLRLDEKIVIIGGGNSAVDSARSARRLSTKDVRILCLTDEMTAVAEEVEEAIKEDIPIDYNNSALEILGENGRVTGYPLYQSPQCPI